MLSWARFEAWTAKDLAQQAVARIAGLEGVVAAIANAHGGGLTPEQIVEAARSGAAAALDAKISQARVEITPKQ